MDERTIKRLMSGVKCSQCGEHYSARNAQITGHCNGLWYVNAYCPTCKTQYMLAVTVSADKTTLFSDLTEAEIPRFTINCAPNADDVLDMHAFLKHFGGDFTQLFGRERVS